MPLVNVLINGHAYTVACDDGEDEHLRELAQFFDKRVREMVSSVGQVGDSRLLLLAGLVVSDELAETLGRLEEIEKEIAGLKERQSDDGTEREEQIARALDRAAERVEAIAARLS
jgi:cell division protein ZapA